MKFFSGLDSALDAKDRRLLLWAALFALVVGGISLAIAPPSNPTEALFPSSYSSGPGGAKAAYESLEASGYSIERWNRPLALLASTAGPETVLISTEPILQAPADFRAAQQILERGGSILVTGRSGAALVPDSSIDAPSALAFIDCKARPEGLDPLAMTGEIWIRPTAGWKRNKPQAHVDYSCGGIPVVVTYPFGKGRVIWWAGSTPLQNQSITRGQNFELLLNSLGNPEGHQFYWDESLHGEVESSWTYVYGPPFWALLALCGLLAILLVVSKSRRAGPLRELPPPIRTSPIEFLTSLGHLYRKAGAASVALAVGYERFSRDALRLIGSRPARVSAADLARSLESRFGPQPELQHDLEACELALSEQSEDAKLALRLVRALHDHRQRLLSYLRRDVVLHIPSAPSPYPSGKEIAS